MAGADEPAAPSEPVPSGATAALDTRPAAKPKPELPPNRDELIPFPIFGGNSDIGVEVGVVGSFARFREGYFPYRFRIDLVLSTSIKSDSRGLRLAQHYETARFDMPQFLVPALRLDARVAFLRAVDATWFGVGNATTVEPRPAPPGTASAYYYVGQTISGNVLLRVKTGSPVDLAIYTRGRYEMPEPSPGSKLAEDLASGAVIGGQAAFLETLAGGLILDTRDDELLPRRGILYAAGMAGTVGTAEQVRFGEGSLSLAHYASFGRALIFANRIITSMKFGTLPFYELQQGDVFAPKYMIGSNKGVRGVRLGRYAGLAKTLVNTELRIIPFRRFKVFSWSILAGASTFFDAGRVWSAYEFDRSRDGSTLGLRWGAGGGVFFDWNQAHVFRIDAAYSPDSYGGPVAFYFDSAFLF